MTKLNKVMTVLLAFAVSGVCLAGMSAMQQATAQNVRAAYISLHGGAR